MAVHTATLCQGSALLLAKLQGYTAFLGAGIAASFAGSDISIAGVLAVDDHAFASGHQRVNGHYWR